MNNLDKQYQQLLIDIIQNGAKKSDRTGTGTLSIFGRQIRHKMSDGFPLLTTKKMAWKSLVTELLWFLRGDTNIKYLIENNCHIWNGDAYKNYTNSIPQEVKLFSSKSPLDLNMQDFIKRVMEDSDFAKKWGELGPVYGKQWRKWSSIKRDDLGNNEQGKAFVDYGEIDQFSKLIDELKINPDSRRLMVSAWNVGEIDRMVLPPCHYGFQVYTTELTYQERYKIWFSNNYETGFEYNEEENVDFDNTYYSPTPTRKISLMWNQRSVDSFLGLPFNIASYGLLLEIIAREVNMVPDELIGNLGDVHLYLNHLEQAKEQIIRKPYNLPRLKINQIETSVLDNPEYWSPNDFTIEGYESHNTIKAPLSN